jgi:hypothetical protein
MNPINETMSQRLVDFMGFTFKNMETQNEIWKDVKDYEGLYLVSNLGRIKSLKRTVKRIDGKVNFINERILKEKKSGANYRAVELCGLGNKRTSTTSTIHRIVAKAFIENPENKPDVNHLDGNKGNNQASNLQWSTKSENSKHAYDLGLNAPPESRSGKYNKSSKTVLQIRMDGIIINTHESTGHASKISGVYRSGISRACQGVIKQAGGFIWKYKEAI